MRALGRLLRRHLPRRLAADRQRRRALRQQQGRASPAYPHPRPRGQRDRRSSTAAVDKLFTWNSVSPRLGFTWKITGDGKTVLKGHYGRYYRGIVTGEFDDVDPVHHAALLFRGTYDDAGQPARTWSSSPTTPTCASIPDFKDPYTDQFIVGFERELAKNLGVSAQLRPQEGRALRRLDGHRRQYEPVHLSPTMTHREDAQPAAADERPTDRLFLLTNPDGMFTRYNGGDRPAHQADVEQLADRCRRSCWSRSTGRLGSSLLGPFSRQSGISRHLRPATRTTSSTPTGG